VKRQEGSGALLLAIGSAYLGLGWEGFWAPLLFPAIALAAYAVVVVGARFRWPVSLVGPATALVFSVGPVVLVASRTGSDPLSTARDLVPRLLSYPYPASSTVELLAPGAVLAALVAVGVAVRVARPGGGRLAPMIGIAVLYVAVAVLSGGRADSYGIVAAALLAAALADWLIEEPARPRRGAEPEQRPGAGSVLRVGAVRSRPVLLPAAAVVLLTAFAPVDSAFEPRGVVQRPVQALVETNPLPLMTQWAREGATVLMRVRAEQPVPLRLVALADYTGDGWRTSGSYGPVGVEDIDPATAALPPGQRRSTVDIEVTLAVDLGGHWLPTPGVPDATSMSDALVQPAAGVLARIEPSPAGFRYRVQADIDTPAPEELAGAPVPQGPGVARYLDLPGLPTAFANLAGSTTSGATSPYERAVRIEELVRSGRRLDASAPAGSSYARLADFLDSGRTSGTAEQFASTFAVLARAAGLPTRVVVGFQLVERDQDGLWVVRGRDALAWPEVYLTGIGWIAFDPRPRALAGG